MKKTIQLISLILAAVLLTASLAACQSAENGGADDGISSASEAFAPHKFAVDDAALNGVKIGMTPEHVKKILGEPKSEQLNDRDNFIYGAYLEMEYEGFTLLFYDINEGEDYTLGMISSSSESVNFAGGLHVGSTKDEVLAAFTHEEDPQPLYFSDMEESCGDYIYGEINSSQFIEYKPEGVIQVAYFNRYAEDMENSYMMEYYYYNPLDWSADKSSFTGDCYSMVFYVESETDTVTSIRISYDLAQ